MSKSVNYVREKKIPALLNDMVVHLLSTKSSDVIDSLIHYLEKHPDAAGHKSEPPKAKAAPPPAAHSTHAAASQPAAAADGHHDKKEEQHAHTPHKPTPPAGEHSHRPVPAAVAAAQTKTEEQAPLPTPAETEKAAQHLLDELVSSEKELAYLLAKAFDSENLSQEERTLVATAASQNAELIKMTAQSDFTHTQVGVALERVRSEMTDTEFYASKGFRLIHDIETNERSVRALFHNIDIDSLRADEGELALQAIRMHGDFLALVDTIEEHQLQIAVKANGGAVNHSVATYFTNLSDALSQVCIDLRSNTASLKSRVPVEAVKNVDAKKVPPKAKSLTAQTNALVSAIKEQETHFLKTIAALNAGDDVELQALLNDAVRNAKELETIAAEVATTSNDVNVGGDNPHLSYDDLRKKIHGLNERVGVKMLLVHKAHTSAISRVTASLTAKAKDDASEITKSVTAALAPHESIPEVKEALEAQKELEKLVSEIDTLQQIISSHNAGH